MIYLTNGNTPLNAAYADKISQEANSTYQLTFRFPTSDALWEKLKEEAFLKADDLHGEQDFVIFEVQKKHGYIQVYANQSFTLLNNYVINPISLDRATGSTALSRFAGSITRENPFSFFSDIDERHTFNTDSVNAMVAFTKDKHSILGQWGGDLVRHGYQVQLLKNGGSENESLFMYKKNLSSYQQKTSTKSLKTRITFKTTVKGEGEKAPDRKFSVVVDSPLINKYSQIYEDVIEVNDQDVKDEAGLRKYGEQYFRTTLCDMLEDSLEIQVEGKSDVPVQIFDVVSLFHDRFKMDVRKKITKYTYSPMAKKLLSIGFGKFKSGLSNMLSNAVNDAVKNETQHLQGEFTTQLAKEIKNADLAFENQKEELVNQFTDEMNAIKAKAEENKRALSDEIDRRFHDFSPAGFEEAKAKAEEALRKVGAGYELADEAKHIADQNSVIFAGLVDKFNKQKDKLGDTITDLKRYAREESTSQARAVREDVTRDFVGKSTFQENVQGVERRLESLSLGTSGNLLKNSNNGFYNQHNKRYRLVETLQANQTYTLVTKYWHGEKSAGHTFLDGIGNWRRLTYNGAIDAWMVQFTPTQEIPAGTEITLSSDPADAKGNMNWATLVRGVIPLIHWQPAKGDVEEGVTQKLAEYKETVDGRFATISSQVNGKVNQSDFQRVKETSQLYERILGSAESDVSNNVSRMVMSSQIFQTEVGKFLTDDINLVYDPTNFSKWAKKQSDANVIEVQAGTKLLRITNVGKNQPVYHGFALPLTTSTFRQGEKLSYRMEVWVDVLPDGPLGIELWASDGGLASDRVTLTKTGIQIITGTMTVQKSSTKSRELPLEIWLTKNGQVAIGQVSLVRGDKPPKKFSDNTSTQDVVTQTRVAQLSDSYAIQTLTGPGAISSQINLNSNNILIEAAKIRLKGRTLLDEITAIDGYFKRLFVGDARIGTLNTDIIRSNSIAADKLIFDTALAKKLVASDVFTDTLAAKTAFINKLRSVVVSATLLEGYKGKIGGFQIGTHEKDPTVFWLTGSNSFRVGMSDGGWRAGQTALWVNWGDNWGKPGNQAWFVKNNGEMHCYNTANFWNTPVVYGNLRVTGKIYYDNRDSGGKYGFWMSSPRYTNMDAYNGYLYFYLDNGTYDWITLNKDLSDRRYKTNIQDSQVSGLDVIDKLKTYSYRKEYDGKVEDISCGIMAQDVREYAPEAFYENPDGAYSYKVFELVPYLIKAIQELNQKVERLEKTT